MDKYIRFDIDSKKTVACVVQKVEKLHLSKAEKHPDFRVTLCLRFDTTNTNFTYNES
jgi:hypothetical protein